MWQQQTILGYLLQVGTMKEIDFIRWMIELLEDDNVDFAISELKAWIGEEE